MPPSLPLILIVAFWSSFFLARTKSKFGRAHGQSSRLAQGNLIIRQNVFPYRARPIWTDARGTDSQVALEASKQGNILPLVLHSVVPRTHTAEGREAYRAVYLDRKARRRVPCLSCFPELLTSVPRFSECCAAYRRRIAIDSSPDPPFAIPIPSSKC